MRLNEYYPQHRIEKPFKNQGEKSVIQYLENSHSQQTLLWVNGRESSFVPSFNTCLPRAYRGADTTQNTRCRPSRDPPLPHLLSSGGRETINREINKTRVYQILIPRRKRRQERGLGARWGSDHRPWAPLVSWPTSFLPRGWHPPAPGAPVLSDSEKTPPGLWTPEWPARAEWNHPDW